MRVSFNLCAACERARVTLSLGAVTQVRREPQGHQARQARCALLLSLARPPLPASLSLPRLCARTREAGARSRSVHPDVKLEHKPKAQSVDPSTVNPKS